MENYDQYEINELIDWLNTLPLSKELHYLHRDISDGGINLFNFLVIISEIIYSYIPNIVSLHNYSHANSIAMKIYNWDTLNRIIFIIIIL